VLQGVAIVSVWVLDERVLDVHHRVLSGSVAQPDVMAVLVIDDPLEASDVEPAVVADEGFGPTFTLGL
jgi:hypothetical protein